MYTRVMRLADANMVAEVGAARLLRTLISLQNVKPMVNLCLTGGRVANLMYASFAEMAAGSALDPARLALWWGDERYVPSTHPERNSQQALSLLARTIPIASANTHLMPGLEGNVDPTEAAFAYANELGDTTFDICLLGVGEDGHVASIFPQHPSMEPTAATVIGVTGAPKPPAERISLTFKPLNRSSQVWFLVPGEAKAEAVRRALDADMTIPAAHVKGTDVTLWFLDEESASQLPQPFTCSL